MSVTRITSAVKATANPRGLMAGLAIAVPAGPVYEGSKNAGASRLLRDMACRDNFGSSSWRMEWDLSNAGVSLPKNFSAGLAGRQYLLYSVTGPADTVCQDAVFSKLVQSAFFPRFHPRDLENWRDYLADEPNSVKVNDPAAFVTENLFQAAFKGSPHGNSLWLPAHNKKSINSEELWDQWTKFYNPNDAMVLASNLDANQVSGIVAGNEWLADLSEKNEGKTPVLAKTTYVGGASKSIHRRQWDYDEQFCNVMDSWTGIAFEAPNAASADSVAAGWIFKSLIDASLSDASPVSSFYTPMVGSGLAGWVFTNVEGEQQDPSARATALLAATKSGDFESAKLRAATAVAARLQDPALALEDLAVHAGSQRTDSLDINAAVKAVKSMNKAKFDQIMSKLSTTPTIFQYGDVE